MRTTSFSKWTTLAFPTYYIMLIWVKFLTVITDPHLGLHSQTFSNKVIIVKERKRILNRKTFLIHVTAMPCHQKVVSHKKIKILKGKWEGKVLHLNWEKKFTVKFFLIGFTFTIIVSFFTELKETKTRNVEEGMKNTRVSPLYMWDVSEVKIKTLIEIPTNLFHFFCCIRHETRCSR